MSFKSISELFEKELKSVSDDELRVTNYLDTGIPQLNSIIAGDPNKGLPTGRIAEISGESASGKTMLSTRLMISAQQQNGFAMFYDHERAYDVTLSVKQGMSIDRNKFFLKKAKFFEDSLVDCVKRAAAIRKHGLIADDAPIVAIFDSFASMIPMSMGMDSKGKEKTVADYTMNDTTALARAASRALPAFNVDVNDLNICAVFINQLADTMEMHGPKKKTKGGNSLPFYASTRLTIKGKEVKEKGILLKKDMTIHTMKNRLRKPGEVIGVDFLFNPAGGGDFDIVGGYTRYLKSLGAIEGAGAWLTFEGERINGIEKLIEQLSENPDTAITRLKACHLEFMSKVDVLPAAVDTDWMEGLEDEDFE